LSNKTSVPVYYRGINYKNEFGCVWIKSRTRTSTYILFYDKTRVHLFYFYYNTTRSIVHLKCAALVFWKAYIERMSFGYANCKSNKHGPRTWSHLLIYK